MAKVWLKEYPAGMPAEIDPGEYASLKALLEDCLKRYADRDAFVQMGARLPRALEQQRPQIVVLELGGNDGLRGLPVQTLEANLDAMIAAIRAAGAKVLLLGIEIPPNYGEAYTQKLRAVYATLARRNQVPFVPFFLDGVALDGRLMQADGVHPNEAGQPRLLENVWKGLEPLLQR